MAIAKPDVMATQFTAEVAARPVSCANAAGASRLMATIDSGNSAYLFIVKLLV
jgi:hypothetical protein